MKLKAIFRDPVAFLRIMQSMAKLSNRCILRCSPDEIHIVIPRGAGPVEAFAVLDNINFFFREYKVESNYNNQVNIELVSEHLCQALKQITPASQVTLKLAKHNNQPVLNVEIITRSKSGQEITVLHEVLIAIKKPRDMGIIRTPERAVEEQEQYYKVITTFPDLAEVRVVAERMRSVESTHDRIMILANLTGEVKVAVQSDTTKVETHWTGMQTNAGQDITDANLAQRQKFRQVNLDARSFVRLLGCTLIDYVPELWIAPKRFATFMIHVRRPGPANESFIAHMQVTLNAMQEAYDE